MAITVYPDCCDPHWGLTTCGGNFNTSNFSECCTPTYCTGNCYSDTCTIYSPACGSNSYPFGISKNAGDLILAVDVNDLQDAIDDERFNRRDLIKDFVGDNVVAGVDRVFSNELRRLRNSINEIITDYTTAYNPSQAPPTSGITTDYPPSKSILASDINELRAKINAV